MKTNFVKILISSACVYFGQPVSENSVFRATCMHADKQLSDDFLQCIALSWSKTYINE